MSKPAKVTYVSLSADSPDVRAAFDAAIAQVAGALGQTHPMRIAGTPRTGAGTFDSRSPADTRVVVARVASGTAADVADAVAAARAAYPAWAATPWQDRARLLDRAAEIIRQRRYELAVWLIWEMGKNRVEALGEIEETADLITYYAQQMRDHNGFVVAMDKLAPTDNNVSVLRPYGVWAVIAPWNFPYALMGAPAAAALLTGNTVVMKPSSETPLSALKLCAIFEEAGLPPGTVNCIAGSGRVVGDGLAMHPDVDGLTFTGSFDVGFKQLYQRFATRYPKPCIVEMGGKNPAIVMDSADLDRAVQGIHRSAFGMNGHKCSACSRVYVHRAVADQLVRRLERAANETRIGDPLLAETFAGPLATSASYDDYQRYVALARGDQAVRAGGEVLRAAPRQANAPAGALGDDPFAHGYFVRPTVVTGLQRDHQLLRDELFVPIVCVQTIDSLDQALEAANDTPFGLTAGFFGQKQSEIDTFLDRIEAGVVYVNRAAGATTGAWPGVQPFGGWKGSGSTGKNIGGHYTVQCYMREQSRTVCE
jgi:1-pyrroline-5-carboxylate dehydrogenase